jgi:polygalacturonase
MATPVILRGVDVPRNLKSPEGTQGPTSAVLIWDKPENYSDVVSYEVFASGKPAGFSTITNYTVKGLKPGKTYSFSVKARNSNGESSAASASVKVTIPKKGQVFNIVDFGAKGDSAAMNTKAIQKAIEACTPGGTVLIPAGVFLSGALFLKSNMTLYIEKGGVLKGSTEIKDYYPLIPTRFEGWTIPESFSSLLTAGTLDPSGKISVENLAIRGEGRISGGDSKLGKAMTAAKGIRSRGRLICLMNCRNIDIQGLTIEKTPCWCIHYTFSRNVSVHDVSIHSTASNGDGIDPDSSVDSYIFNCTFSTGDDCIAIKSGKNPEGNVVNKPTSNVWITNCNFVRGHSLAIGSEMSGGVENVIVRDCFLGNLYYGMQIKGTKDRGGYVQNISVKDCDLQQIKIVTSVNYNNDGASAPELPVFRNMEFSNLNMTKAGTKAPVIFIEGFDDPQHYTNNISLKNILLPENSKVYLRTCRDIRFENVTEVSGKKPEFEIISSENIVY